MLGQYNFLTRYHKKCNVHIFWFELTVMFVGKTTVNTDFIKVDVITTSGDVKTEVHSRCLQNKKCPKDRWSQAVFHSMLLSLCLTPPRQLILKESCPILWNIWSRTLTQSYYKVKAIYFHQYVILLILCN